MTNADDRKAATSTIHNFGMTPHQLFTKPHPKRTKALVAKATNPIFSPDLFIEQQATVLVQSIVPIHGISGQVSTLVPSTPEKTYGRASQEIDVLGTEDMYLRWGYTDRSLRLLARGSSAPLKVFENMHQEFISTACFADSMTLITGSTESVTGSKSGVNHDAHSSFSIIARAYPFGNGKSMCQVAKRGVGRKFSQ